MRRFYLAIMGFSIIGLLGPVLRRMVWPPSGPNGGVMSDLINDLVYLLWPAQALAAVEVNIGTNKAAFFAVAANILLFGVIGVLLAIVATRRTLLVIMFFLLSGLVSYWALWGAGFSLKYLNWSALVIALFVYALPFIIVPKLLSSEKK